MDQRPEIADSRLEGILVRSFVVNKFVLLEGVHVVLFIFFPLPLIVLSYLRFNQIYNEML